MIRTSVKVLLGLLFLIPAGFAGASNGPLPAGQGDPSTPQDVEQLEEQVRTLLDENQMLLENLVECAKELEELRRKSTRPESVRSSDKENRLRMIDRIEEALGTQRDLEFLECLEMGQLRMLLNTIRQALN